MDRIVIITGIPGTGKTTVCNIAQKLASKIGLVVNVINYGTVMLEILQKHRRKMERDSLRKTDTDFQRKLQSEAAKEIVKRTECLSGITIIDTHMSVKVPEGYLPGLPYHILQLLKPKMLVLVEAQPYDISSRRMKNSSRKRDEAVEEEVKEELLFSRLMAGVCAIITGAPVKIVINVEGKKEETAKEILKVLEAM